MTLVYEMPEPARGRVADAACVWACATSSTAGLHEPRPFADACGSSRRASLDRLRSRPTPALRREVAVGCADTGSSAAAL